MSNFGDKSEYEDELKRIVTCVKSLRSKKFGKTTCWDRAAECHIKYSNLNGESVLALTITLSPTGCEWAKKGGCTMCGEFEGSTKGSSLTKNPQFHVAQFAAAIGNQQVWDIAKREKKPITWLRINQEGNYINSKEMDVKAQECILRLAMHIEGVKRITIESRPQYITKDTVSSLVKLFAGSGIELEIGMGVEAQNDVIRNICINKQGTKNQFKKAVRLLNDNGIFPLAYVLLKPPFLTEQEAIEEAVSTAHFAKEIGFARISFEPMSIHYYTLVHALTCTGDYTTPWLWSVAEVAKRCSDISYMFGIGGVGYFPVPAEYSSNQCTDERNCSVQFAKAIIDYNRLRDANVFDQISCSCKKDWIVACQQENKPLKDRIQEQLSRVEALIPNYVVQDEAVNSVVRNSRLLMSYSQ